MCSQYKKCSRCQQEKHLSDFTKNRSKPDGYQTECRKCRALSKKEYYKRHPESKKKSKASHRSRHREELALKTKEWKRANPDLVKQQKYRRRGALSGRYTASEWAAIKKQYKHTCPCCGKKEPEIKLTVDHIVPIVCGGSNNKENLQPLCVRCNTSKQAKTISYGMDGQLAFVLVS